MIRPTSTPFWPSDLLICSHRIRIDTLRPQLDTGEHNLTTRVLWQKHSPGSAKTFAHSKAAAAVPTPTTTLPAGQQRTFFRRYDENGDLVDEQVSRSFAVFGDDFHVGR